MNIRDYNEKHKQGALSDEEWEKLTQHLLNAKFDREKSKEWAQMLKEQGIERNPTLIHSPVKRLNLPRFAAIAAAFIALAAATWFFVLQPRGETVRTLAANHLEQPFRFNGGNTRGEDSMEKNRGRALEAFANKDYEKSLDYLQQVEAEGQAKAADYFQMGLCLLYQKNADYRGALNAFNKATDNDPNAYKDEIYWFSALCYIQLGDNTQAGKALNHVIESPSSRDQEKARQLLEAMNE